MAWYTGMTKLHQAYHKRGLNIVTFPCNQFLSQEPEGAETISACVRAKYCDGFEMMEKINVNGTNTHPVYQFLRVAAAPDGEPSPIKWNFCMFLVSGDGKKVTRFGANQSPGSIAPQIEEALSQLSSPLSAPAMSGA